MAQHNELGKWGEELAARYLQELGYSIIESDWKSGHRDIDIIAMDGDEVVFVEVKTRSNTHFAEPIDAVNYHKMMNLRRSFNHYIK
ncbi:MAG: YraN family protein, partial [Prevotella sp.]|nr:YraN family protein [Prevotella sp.]